VQLFGLGPVFSAFGSSVSDISHVYERSFHLMFLPGTDVTPFNRVIDDLRNTGIRDLLGEGIGADGAACSVELELSHAGQSLTVRCPQRRFASIDDLRSQLGSDLPSGEMSIELVRLQIRKAITKPTLTLRQLAPADPAGALLGRRTVAYGSRNGEAKLYKWESLRPGNQVEGCSILEAGSSTYFVPEGWKLLMDPQGNAQLTRTASGTTSAILQETQTHGRQ
jgi:N-methylhydantoinase A/oxoprolinase/acetone carboxylase beta subunit